MGYQPSYRIAGGKDNKIVNAIPSPPKTGSIISYHNKENDVNNLPTNCINCGAPLHSHHCEYCDTNY